MSGSRIMVVVILRRSLRSPYFNSLPVATGARYSPMEISISVYGQTPAPARLASPATVRPEKGRISHWCFRGSVIIAQ
jgi:hypothetical protein